MEAWGMEPWGSGGLEAWRLGSLGAWSLEAWGLGINLLVLSSWSQISKNQIGSNRNATF